MLYVCVCVYFDNQPNLPFSFNVSFKFFFKSFGGDWVVVVVVVVEVVVVVVVVVVAGVVGLVGGSDLFQLTLFHLFHQLLLGKTKEE